MFGNVTTAVAASLGFLIVLASCNGTSSVLKVVHAAGTITGMNTPGSAADLDLTADWYLGSDGGAANFLDADTALWWADDSFIDFADADAIEQFWDTTADLLRDPGADGSNPVDGAFSPLVCHKSRAASHVSNAGTGGDADTAGTFTDGMSPGTYADDLAGEDPALAILATFDAWWENDYGGNTKSGTVQTWADKTANVQDLTQGTAGDRPADGGLYADFDGAADELNSPPTPTAYMQAPWNSGGGTTFFVLAPDSDGANDLGAIYDHGLSEGLRTVGQVGSDLAFQVQGRYQLNQGVVRTTSLFPVATVHILVVRWNKSAGTGVNGITMNVNSPTALTVANSGLTVDSTNTGNVHAPGTTFAIGGRAGLINQNFDGKIYMGAFKSGLMSDADVNTVGAYLASKYSGTWV